MRPSVIAAAILVAGCSRPAPPSPAGCPTWTEDHAGTCALRRWIRPARAEAVGDAGAMLRTLALDGEGLGVATWDLTLPGRPAVRVGEEIAPGLWVDRDPTARIGGANAAAVAAAGPDGSAIVTWVHAGEAPGVYVAARDPWGSWADPAPGEVESFAPGGVEPWAAITPSGEQILAWCQQTRTGWGVSVARRARAADPWARPRDAEDVVSPPVLFANQPQIAADARGDVIVAWYQSEGAPLMTYASERRGPGGSFSHPGVHDHLSPPGGPVASDAMRNPIPALGPRGEAAVVWTQEKGDLAPAYAAVRGETGPWTKPRDLMDAIPGSAGVSRTVQAAFDPQGTLWVAFSRTQKGKPGEILAGRRYADGSWDIHPISSPGRRAYGPSLAVGPEGGVLVAWVEEEAPRKPRVAARRTGGDRKGWTEIEAISGPETPPAGPPVAAMGRADRAVVGWSAGSLASPRVVFARVE